MFLDGLIVTFFFCLYFLVPVTLAWMTTALQPMDFLVPATKWGWHLVRGDVVGNLTDIFEGVLWRYVQTRAMIVLYLVLAWPLFTAAGIRFVLTREAASFVLLPACLGILFRRLGAFLKFLILAGLTAVAILILDIVTSSTGIGVPLTIPIGAAGIWVLTYLFANLAVKVQPKPQPAEVRPAMMVANVQGPLR